MKWTKETRDESNVPKQEMCRKIEENKASLKLKENRHGLFLVVQRVSE